MMTLPVPSDRPLVVFTDLDGTLIDHHNYGIEASREAIRKLTERKAPLVFCSSKTFAEQVHLQRQLGMQWPFIFENGSAAAIPQGYFPEQLYTAARSEQGYDLVVFAHADAATLRSVLSGVPAIKGYADASDTELSTATGLIGEYLQRARDRWFTETLLSPLNASRVVQVNHQLMPKGFVLSRGGRFYTAQSDSVSKGKAVEWMKEIFRRTSAQEPCFAATGDSPNDVPMLEVVDLPFLVQGPAGTWAEMEITQLIKIDRVGPQGFSMAVDLLIKG